MPKPIRHRARWRSGELTGAEAAQDAGGTVCPVFAAQDHYDAATDMVQLTLGTALGRTFGDVVRGVHEAMHARQWSEVSLSTIFYKAGIATRLPWLVALVALAYFTAAWQLWPALSCFGAMLLLSLFKAATILNLEREAWDMTREWLTKHYLTTHLQWAEIERMEKDGMRSYVEGFFNRK